MTNSTIETAIVSTDDALGKLDAVGIAQAIKDKSISRQEAVDAAIQRAEQVNPKINAIAIELFQQAREQAASEDDSAGFFSGVPTFVKDMDDLEGVPTTYGTRCMPHPPAEQSGAFVKQFLQTGVIPLGKSTVPELGTLPTSEATLFGATRNPWNLDYSSGGSSGGAAALVAAGVVPIAHTNDGGGSTRIPASCCGLVGLKPTRARLRGTEASETLLPIDIVCQGIASRTVRDTAHFMAEAERYYSNKDLPTLGLIEKPGKRRLRIALCTELPSGISCDSVCESEAYRVAKLCEGLGHSVEVISSLHTQADLEDMMLMFAYMSHIFHTQGPIQVGEHFDASKFEAFATGLNQQFMDNAPVFESKIEGLKKLAHRYQDIFTEYDVVLSPTLSRPTVKIGYLNPEQPFQTVLQRELNYIPFTPMQNFSGNPSISLPLAQTADGMPIGMMFTAALGDDVTLLELAHELEEASPWQHLWD